MGFSVFLFLSGLSLGSVIGFFVGYLWFEQKVAEKVHHFSADIYSESLEFRDDIRREVRELRDSLKK